MIWISSSLVHSSYWLVFSIPQPYHIFLTFSTPRELSQNLVVTPQWERHLRSILEAYSDAFDREDERDIGIWISGFFGSGKSLLMKVLGLLLEGGEIQGEVLHDLFLNRLSQASTERADITRFLAICQRKIATSLVGGNLHARQAKVTDPLSVITFKLF